MSESIKVLIKEEDVRARIAQMADVISEKYAGKQVLLIGILTGCVFFMTELAQELKIPAEMDFMSASSYGSDTTSSGNVVVKKELDRSLEGKHVIVVEDIIDTGRTLNTLMGLLAEMNPASLEVAALLDKPSRRQVDFKADYVGFEIPDEFVIGWGLDYDQRYRDLPFIGIIEN